MSQKSKSKYHMCVDQHMKSRSEMSGINACCVSRQDVTRGINLVKVRLPFSLFPS